MEHNYQSLINTIQETDGVLSIGKSGGSKLPARNESDIDIFVFCSHIPTVQTRQAAIKRLAFPISEMTINETGGRFWGVCDFLTIDDSEICLMYFTTADMDDETESVLNGSRLDRESEYFYPTGRCATFLSMHILYDKTGYIAGMKARLSTYPLPLAQKLYNHHVKKINDTEDFERAVARSDVLFYHATLEIALDHFLQALFALNERFFPSRKRSLQLIYDFKYQPVDCAERLLEVIALGAHADTLAQSYEVWCALCKEFTENCDG